MSTKKSFKSVLGAICIVLLSSTLYAQIATPPSVVGDLNVCNGGSAILTANDPTDTQGATFRWYSTLLGLPLAVIQESDSIALGPELFTLGLTNTYGVSTYDPNTGDESTVTTFNVNVGAGLVTADVITTTPDPLTVCSGESAAISPVSTNGNTVFRWYDALVNGQLLFEGTGDFNTPALGVGDLFFVTSIDANTGCESTPRTPVVAPVVLPTLSLPVPIADPLTICSGDTAKVYTTNLSPGDQVNWYDALVGGELLFTGDTFLLDSVNTGGASLPITVYAEFEDTDGCRSLRVPAIITVLPALDVPLVDNPLQTICTGEDATFNASSLLGGATFHWYDAPLAGNRIFTGASFNTGAINNSGAVDLTRMYYVSVEDGAGCESVRLPVTLVITPALDLPIVTPPAQQSCPGDSVTFVASSLLGAGTTFRWYDALVGGTLLHTGAEFNTGPLPNGGPTNLTQNYFVEVEDAMGCVSLRNIASVLILPALDVPTYMPLAPIICAGDSVEFTASSTITDLADYFWYDDLASTTPIASGETFNTGAIVNNGAADLIRIYYLEGVDNDGCRTVRVPVTVTIQPALDVPLVTPLAELICNGDSIEFTASSLLGAGITYRWYNAPTGGTLLNQGETFNTGPLTNANPVNTTQTFWVELEDQNGCRSVRTPAAAVIRPALDVPLVIPPVVTICNGESAELGATSLFPNAVSEFRWYDQITGGNLLFTGDTVETGPITNTSGTDVSTMFYVELEDTAGCVSLRTPVTVVVRPALDLPIVLPPVQTICNGQSAEFVATSLLGAETFRWYDAFVGGTLLAEGDTFNTGPLTNASGTDLVFNYFVEAVDTAGCASVRLPVSAIIRPNLDLPVAIPPAAVVCSGERATFTATSVGNIAGQNVTFNWYDELVGGTLLFTGDTFQTDPLVNSTGTDITGTFFLEAVDTNGCQSLRTPVSIVIRPAIDLPIVTPPIDVICTGDSAQFIATSLLGSAMEFHWYDSLLGGNLLFSGDTFNTGPINNAGTADLNRVYFVELEDTAGCRSIRVPVTLIIRPSIVVPIVNPPLSVVCQGDSVQLVATSLIDAEYKWYDSIAGGNLLFQGDTFISGPLTNATGTDLDTLFYVEAVDTAGCISAVRNFGTVIIRPSLNLPLVSPLADTVCSGGEVEFVASSLLPGAINFYWYEDLLGGSPIFVGDTFRTNVTSNGSPTDLTRMFYVEVEDNTGCRSLRVPVTVLITPGLVPPLVNPAIQRICSGNQATIVASSALGTASTFRWYDAIVNGNLLFEGDTFVTDTLFNTGNGDLTRTFFVEQRDSLGGCASIRIPASVIITRSPDNPTIENQFNVICSGEQVTFIAEGPEGLPGTIKWYESMTSNTVLFEGDTFTTDPLTNTGALATTHDFFAEFTDTTGCISQRTPGYATVRPLLDLPTATPGNQTVCSGGDATVVGNSLNPSTETFNWYDQATGGTPIFTGDTLVLVNLQNNSGSPMVNTYYIESVDSAGCLSPRNLFTVTIQAASTRPTVDPPSPSFCTGSNVVLTANSDFGDEGIYYWYETPSSSTPFFTGRVYTTPKLYNFDGSLVQEDYYVQVEDTVGCTSNLREVIVKVTTNGDVVSALFDQNPVCEGNSVTLIGQSQRGFNDYKWYVGPKDTLPFFEGDTLVTDPILSDTVIYLSSFNGDCSSRRTPIFINTQEVNMLTAPSVTCVENGDGNRVTFQWDPVDNATSYQVSEDGGVTWINPSNPDDLQHDVQREDEEQDGAELIVRARQPGTGCTEPIGPNSTQVFCSFEEFDSDEIFNSFSPNGDGINDVWYITDGLEKLTDNRVTIFNRWGKEIFNTTGYDNANNVFTGEGYEDGAYFYIIEVPSQNIKKTGYVMIIR